MIARQLPSQSVALLAGSLMMGSCVSPLLAEPPGLAGNQRVSHVGPTEAIKTIAQLLTMVGTGNVIEVDSGEYAADLSVREQDGVTMHAVGIRVRLLAQGVAAKGKGMRVEDFNFESAAMPNRNGAGIRLETISLWVRSYRFLHNEMVLLTNNGPNIIREIEGSTLAQITNNHDLHLISLGAEVYQRPRSGIHLANNPGTSLPN